jgi:hypothetical protein
MTTSEQLERKAEATRAQIIDSIEELRERLTPGQIMDRTLDFARDGRAGQFVRNFGQQVIENPIPAMLIGAGIGWLMLGSRSRSNGSYARVSHTTDQLSEAARTGARVKAQASDAASQMRGHAEGMAQRAGESIEEWSTRMQGRASEISQRTGETTQQWAARTRGLGHDMAERAGETADEWAGRMRRTADDMTQRAGESAEQWSTRMRDAISDLMARANSMGAQLGDAAGAAGDMAVSAFGGARDAASGAYDATASGARYAAGAVSRSASAVGSGAANSAGSVAQFLKDEPLVLAGIGVALGAALGAMLPESETEDRLMGTTSDALKRQVVETAQDQWEKGKAVANTVAEKGLDEFKHEASEQGLMGMSADNSSIVPPSGPAEHEVKASK